jgi:hypothetical protein
LRAGCTKHYLNSTRLALADTAPTLPRRIHGVPDQGDVRVIGQMTVRGSFDARTTALSGSRTASVSGSSTFDGERPTLDTGIDLRRQHLRTTYLEVDRGVGYDIATLSVLNRTAGRWPTEPI